MESPKFCPACGNVLVLRHPGDDPENGPRELQCSLDNSHPSLDDMVNMRLNARLLEFSISQLRREVDLIRSIDMLYDQEMVVVQMQLNPGVDEEQFREWVEAKVADDSAGVGIIVDVFNLK